MKRLVVNLVVAVLAGLAAGQISARADTIFSNFGSGESLNSSAGWFVDSGQVIASAFTPTSNFTLSQLDIALSYYSGTNNGARVLLETATAGLPSGSGSALESWTLGSLPTYGSPYVPETLSSAGGVTLTNGTQYWLVADPADSTTTDVWNINNAGQSGVAFAVSPTASQWFYAGGSITPAFDVLGRPITATPESGSTVLFLGLDMLILAGLAVPLRRRLVSLL